ncbi:MAG: DUF262 domain-containing protein [Akkermansia sp.]|nr:DUF262 domain-containing protein [Akkermansia sp.]
MSEEEAKQVNACLNSNSNVKLYSLIEFFEMHKRSEKGDVNGPKLGIPAVQRGLVWDPSKIVNLWDSLVKRYPIGIFQCYIEKKGKNKGELALIDGQQRLNAICLGFEDSQQARLWVAEGDDGEPIFMVTTRRHPWGYQRETVSDGVKLKSFSAADRDEQNQKLKKDNDKNDIFMIAPLSDVDAPLEEYHNKYKYCPLPSILNTKTPPDGFKNLWNSEWAIQLRDRANKIVPVVTIPDFAPEPAKLREVFSRINRGGSTLTTRDELYSAICVHGEKDSCGEKEAFSIKAENDKLRENFLPAERITRLAARMTKSIVSSLSKANRFEYTANVPTETICTWFQNDEKNDNGACELVKLYEDSEGLRKVKETFMACVGKDDDRVPSYIYLRDREDNWLYVIFSLIRKYPKCFEEESNSDRKKNFQLLCLLPYVMCGTSAAQGRRNFCEGFYNTAMNSTSASNILDLMAIGMIGASFNHAFTWPYPYSIENHSDEKDFASYSTYWLDIYRCIYGRADNNILYYYQRKYVNKMLQSGFDPAEPSTWEGHENKPWDMDHIIPDAWWKDNNANNNVRNEIGNMQVMYFRHNRMKNDSYAGAYDLSQQHTLEDENILEYFLYKPDEYENIKTGSDLNQKIGKVRKRQNDIINKVYFDLGIGDLINRIRNIETTENNWLVKAAKIRYEVFNKLNRSENNLDQWGICTYDWKRQQKSVTDITWVSLTREPLFYETLTTWLIIGKQVKYRNVDVLLAVQSAIDVEKKIISYEVIYSRPIGFTSEEWIKVCREAKWERFDDWIAVRDSKCQGEAVSKCQLPVDGNENVINKHYELVCGLLKAFDNPNPKDTQPSGV